MMIFTTVLQFSIMPKHHFDDQFFLLATVQWQIERKI
jgi:hypothetical protein